MPGLKELYTPPSAKDFEPYLRSITPPLRAEKLAVNLMEGDERAEIRMPFTGDASLVVVYESKGRRNPGAIASFAVEDSELTVLQLQGAAGAGYRVNTGLRWVPLIADQMQQLVEHPESEIERITVPDVTTIAGINGASATAYENYRGFASRFASR